MISTKKLMKMAKKWQQKAAANRKRISSWSRDSQQVANEGHFAIYTSDGKRFMIPLTYLKSEIFIDLFRMVEEDFGVTSSGPITLPCDSTFMEYTISLIQRRVTKDLEKALIMSLAGCRYSSLPQERANPHFISSF